jgi:hypothetical protein
MVKPFELPMLNYLEILNEISILIATYHLFLFTDYADSPDLQYLAGWSMIAISTFNIVINMIVMLVISLRKIIFIFKKLRH